MPYDLFPEVEREAVARAQANLGYADPSMFTGFFKGAGMYAMRSFADTARAADLAGAVAPIALDKLTGSTARQDQYFAEHDAVFNNAVDYWTPKPGEVGAAGQIVGSLAGSLPLVIVNPAAAVASTQLSAGEDLVRQGVDSNEAGVVGAIQGASLAVGLRLPFLGKSLASRVISGAAGNLAQGIAGAAASRGVLLATGNEKEAEQFNPWDPTQRSLDVLMGLAFGGLAHLDARAQERYNAARNAMWDQASKDALLVLNQAKHVEDVALPGKAETPFELNKGVKAVQTALDQMLRGEPVNVEQITQGLRVTADPDRVAWRKAYGEAMSAEAKRAVTEAVLQNEALRTAEETPGFLRTAEQSVALKKGQVEPAGNPEIARAIEIANKPGFLRTAEEKLTLDRALSGRLFDDLTQPIEPSSPLARQTAQEPAGAKQPKVEAETPPKPGAPTGEARAQAQPTVPADPMVDTATRIAAERPDMQIPTGEVDADGRAVTVPVSEYMAKAAEAAQAATADAGIFKTAITCLLGVL